MIGSCGTASIREKRSPRVKRRAMNLDMAVRRMAAAEAWLCETHRT